MIRSWSGVLIVAVLGHVGCGGGTDDTSEAANDAGIDDETEAVPPAVAVPDAGADPAVFDAGAAQLSIVGTTLAGEGESISLRLAGSTAGTSVRWDLGDGTVVDGALEIVHAYAQNGEYAIYASVDDGSGNTRTASNRVIIENRLPRVFAKDSVEWITGESLSFGFVVTDPGANDSHTVTVDWGDGDSSVADEEALRFDITSLSHVYAEPGEYDVVVTAVDDAGGEAEHIAQVAISDGPQIFASLDLRTWSVVGETFAGRVIVHNFSGDDVGYTLVDPPSGVEIDATTGIIEWTPTEAGVVEIAVEAKNASASVISRSEIVITDLQVLAQATISSSGGSVRFSEPGHRLDGTEVEIPAGAVSEDTVIAIAVPTVAPPLAFQGSAVVELLPSGLQFAVPVTLRLPGPEERLPEGAELGVQTYAQPEYSYHGSRPWIPVPHSGFRAESGMIEAKLEHFSPYQIYWSAFGYRTMYSDSGRFLLVWDIGSKGPLCTSVEAANPSISGCNASYSEGGGFIPYEGKADSARDPAIPDYIENLAASMDATFAQFRNGYPVDADGDAYVVHVRSPHVFGDPGIPEIEGTDLPPEWETILNGVLQFTDIGGEGLAGAMGIGCTGDYMQVHPRIVSENWLSLTGAHEFFHTLQCPNIRGNAWAADRLRTAAMNTPWLEESTAESAAMHVFAPDTTNQHFDPYYLYSTPMDSMSSDSGGGYFGFVLWEYMIQRHGLDFPYILFGGEEPLFLKGSFLDYSSAVEWVYGYLETEFPDEAERLRLWQDFGYAYQYARDPDWVRYIDRRPGGYARPIQNPMTGAERVDSPLALEDHGWSGGHLTETELPPGHVVTYAIDLRLVCPQDDGPNCLGNESLSEVDNASLVLEAGFGGGASGRIYLVRDVDSLQPQDPDDPEDQGNIDANTTVRKIPLMDIDDGDHIVVSVVNPPGGDTVAVALSAYFEEEAVVECSPVAAGSIYGTTRSGLYSWAVIYGALWEWGGHSSVPRVVSGFEEGVKCVATGFGGLQVLSEDGTLHLIGGADEMPEGAFASDVATMIADAYATDDGNVYRFGYAHEWVADEVTDDDLGLCSVAGWKKDRNIVITTPEIVPGMSDIVQLAGDPTTNLMARDSNGRVFWFGERSSNQGDGTIVPADAGTIRDGGTIRLNYPELGDRSVEWQSARQVTLPGSAEWISGKGDGNQAVLKQPDGDELWNWGNKVPGCPSAQMQVAECRYADSRFTCDGEIGSGGDNLCAPCLSGDCQAWAPRYEDGTVATTDDRRAHCNPHCLKEPSDPATGFGNQCCWDGAWICEQDDCVPPSSGQWSTGHPSPVLAVDSIASAERNFDYHAILADGTVVAHGTSDSLRGDGDGPHVACEQSEITKLGTDVTWIGYGGGVALFFADHGDSISVYGTGQNRNGALGRDPSSITSTKDVLKLITIPAP